MSVNMRAFNCNIAGMYPMFSSELAAHMRSWVWSGSGTCPNGIRSTSIGSQCGKCVEDAMHRTVTSLPSPAEVDDRPYVFTQPEGPRMTTSDTSKVTPGQSPRPRQIRRAPLFNTLMSAASFAVCVVRPATNVDSRRPWISPWSASFPHPPDRDDPDRSRKSRSTAPSGRGWDDSPASPSPTSCCSTRSP